MHTYKLQKKEAVVGREFLYQILRDFHVRFIAFYIETKYSRNGHKEENHTQEIDTKKKMICTFIVLLRLTFKEKNLSLYLF